MDEETQSKANNTAGCWLYKNLQPIYQSTRVIVSRFIAHSSATQNFLILMHKLAVYLHPVSLLSLFSSLLYVSLQPAYNPLL